MFSFLLKGKLYKFSKNLYSFKKICQRGANEILRRAIRSLKIHRHFRRAAWSARSDRFKASRTRHEAQASAVRIACCENLAAREPTFKQARSGLARARSLRLAWREPECFVPPPTEEERRDSLVESLVDRVDSKKRVKLGARVSSWEEAEFHTLYTFYVTFDYAKNRWLRVAREFVPWWCDETEREQQFSSTPTKKYGELFALSQFRNMRNWYFIYDTCTFRNKK